VAIFHCETKPVQRSSGRSAVAASAYRTASKMKDERTGKTHNYSNKSGVVGKDCFLFQDGQKVKLERLELWNTAERVEKRADSRTARDYIINLPYELTQEQRAELADQIAEHIAQTFNVAVDYAIHLPDTDKGGDDRNHHVHILTTTRHAKLDQNGVIVLGDKADIEKKNSDLKKQGKPVTQQIIKDIRKDVADLINNSLEQAKIAQRVDSRSYKEQGKTQLPTIHLGVEHTNIMRKGGTTHKTMINELVHQANAEQWQGTLDEYIDKTIYDLEQQIIVKSRKQPEPQQATDKPVIGKPVAPVTVAPERPQTADDYLASLKAQIKNDTPEQPTVIDEYEQRRQKLAQGFFNRALKALSDKYNKIVAQVKEIEAKRPKVWQIWESKDIWQSKLDTATAERDTTKQAYQELKRQGVSSVHFEQAERYIKEREPDLYNRYLSATEPEPERFNGSDKGIDTTPPTVQQRELSEKAKIGLQTLKNVINAMPNGEKKDKAMAEFEHTQATATDEQLQALAQIDIKVNKAPTIDIKAPSDSRSPER
jgi:RNase H-fold protein (predicted Holliday junction resolvase)